MRLAHAMDEHDLVDRPFDGGSHAHGCTRTGQETGMTSQPRGIEHIGITVPDHDAAVRFFEQAFGATSLFSLVNKGETPLGGPSISAKNGQLPGTSIVAVTMMRLHNGPNVEIFEMDHPRRKDSDTSISDYGISHFSLNVDDMDTVTTAFVRAGGRLLDGPYDLTGQEEGQGNRGRFGVTPWGLLIEFESFGSPIKYDPGATEQRWIPATR